jgi:hypothetical protein
MTEIREVSLKQVERGIEEALRNFTGQGANNGGQVPEITARDIEEAGQAAVNIANDIMAEAQQLAAELRANGMKMSEHLKQFAMLANKVSTAMRNTRAEVLNSEDPLPTATMLPPMADRAGLPTIPDRETMQ